MRASLARVRPAVLLLVAVPVLAALVYRRRRRRPQYASPLEVATACSPCDTDKLESPPTPLQHGSASATHSTPRRALVETSPRDICLTKDPEATTRRANYIDWHDYFMSIAMLSAYRSKDPNRQVGACIVDPKTQRIVGIGYNGFPLGCSDDKLPWARNAASQLDTKNPYVCHAEMNAIFNKNCSSLEGCRIYTTLFPCNECTKMIIQSRMLDIVYLSDEKRDEVPMKASRRMLKLAGVAARAHTPTVSRVVVDFDCELAGRSR